MTIFLLLLLWTYLPYISIFIKICRFSKRKQGLNNISIGSWNVHGIYNSVSESFKTDDSGFVYIVNKLDIVGLVETWHDKENIPAINGYKSFSVVREKESRGGIIYYIRDVIASSAVLVKGSCDDFCWIKLDKSFYGLEKNLYIGTIYIPPEHSSLNLKRNFDIWNSLEEDITKFSEDGYIYLQGDFNSRTSNTPDFVQNDSLQYIPLPNSYICDSDINLRNNLDKSVNAYGYQLSSLCVALGLRILNGRFLGDSQGNFTSFQYNGCSVVDYGIICRNILDKINYFKVHPLTTFSDHCMISTDIDVKIRPVSKHIKN